MKQSKKKKMDALENDGWEVVEKGTFILQENVNLAEKNSVFLAPRNSNVCEIFFLLFGDNVGKSIAGADEERHIAFFRYLSLRMIMHGLPPPANPGVNKEREGYLQAASHLSDLLPATNLWGYKKYFRLRDSFPVSEEHVRGPIAELWSSLIRVGESVAFDEKQRKWRGKSMFIHMNRAKPEPIGHMVCQLTAALEAAPVPFTVGLYPYTTNRNLGHHISADTLLTWAGGLIEHMHYIDRKPILVNDSLYTTTASRAAMGNMGQRFISAQKPSWWTAMESLLLPKVREPGETAYAWNKSKGLVVCCHFDPGRGGKRKYVVSNAFSHRAPPEYNKLNPPVYSEYAATFSACDQFNMRLSNNWYPYRAGHWEKHFECLYLSIAFMNFYAVCLHLKIIDEAKTFKQFLVDAGVLLAQKFFK